MTKATLGITLIKTKNVWDWQHLGREGKISLNNLLEQCFSFVFILPFLLLSILESYLNFNYPTNPNSERVVSLVSSCSIIFLSLFFSRPLLWSVASVGPALLNAETRSCTGNVDGHPSYTRFIFLRATKKKEVSGKEMDERTHTKREKLISRLRADRNEGGATCFVFVKLRKGWKNHTVPFPKSFHNETCEV